MNVRLLEPADAADYGLRPAYLADPTVLHWVAEEGGDVVGFLHCYVERRRHGDELQLLLYEIEVNEDRWREGIGRALVAAMDAWMTEHGVAEVWVLAHNPGAEAFYVACGFARDELQGVQYVKRRAQPTEHTFVSSWVHCKLTCNSLDPLLSSPST